MKKENEENAKFFIGLDIGTESVGFSGTDENYHVLQRHGKPLMGVRLFDEAQTAEVRRMQRATKVRKNRVKFRIALLQKLLGKQIEAVDPLFFIRLKASSFWEDDKRAYHADLLTRDSLFGDSGFTDKDYFKAFPTVYHLRACLIDGKNWGKGNIDIRLLYLACHHILKNRGHFLYDSDSFDMGESEDFSAEQQGERLLVRLNEYLQAESDVLEQPSATYFSTENFKEIIEIAKDKKLRNSQKEEALQKLFGINKSKKEHKRAVALLKLSLGLSAGIADILPQYKKDELEDGFKASFTFAKGWEDAKEAEYRSFLGDDFELVEILNTIYKWFTLMLLLEGEKYVSTAMIRKYNEHKRQLDALKAMVKTNAPEKYHKIFRSAAQANNYAAYIGSTLCGGKTVIKKTESADAFYNFLRKELGGLLPDEVLETMELRRYLPKLRTKENATIPYQLHKSELNMMLHHAERVGMIDSDTVGKIMSIIDFRVPYYAGRLNANYNMLHPQDKSRHAWVVKRSDEPVYPWNYQDVIDLPASGEKFITRMLSKCTYLRRETVLPKNSLLYSEFMVLNELNNLRVNGEAVPAAIKQRMFEELFRQYRKVKPAMIVDFLRGVLGCEIKESDLTGVDLDKCRKSGFSSLASYCDAKRIFGEENMKKAETVKIVEDVLLWHALFTDKKQVVEKIKTAYPELNDEVVKQLKALNFSGFGNLSRRLLEDRFVCRDDSPASVIELLWSTEQNLNQILFDPQYGISDWLKAENNQGGAVDFDELIAGSYAAPAVKRAVKQAVRVVDELIELSGKVPDKIFVEVIRSGKAEKERTKSRWETLKERILKSNRELLDELKNVSDHHLRDKRLYLYFLQCGKCAYSGEKINISDILGDSAFYDIDHIIPQALKKDDGLSNIVLVKRELNMAKGKTYPLNRVGAIAANWTNLTRMWEDWHKSGLITSEKLARLKRTTEIGEKELEGFIARQLTFTGQSTIAVARLLEEKYGKNKTEIVYSKAELVSDFRKKFGLLKCRDINDHHHAHDAYLNIVVGNTYHTRYRWNRSDYIARYERTDETWKAYSENRLFDESIPGAFRPFETLETVRRALSLKYLPVSKKTQEKRGQLFKQTIWPAEQHQRKKYAAPQDKQEAGDTRKKNLKTGDIPRKGNTENPLSDTKKYGGYSDKGTAYFMIVEYKEKKNLIRAFEPVYLLGKKNWESLTEEEQEAKLSVEFGTAVKIIIPKILIHSLFKIGPMECRLSGRSGGMVLFHNAKQLFADPDTAEYVRLIAKYNQKVKEKQLKPEIDGKAGHELTCSKNLKLWNVLLEKINSLYGEKAKDLTGKNLGLPDLYEKLEATSDNFKNLGIVPQIGVLTALIIGLGCNASAFDLKALGLGKVGIICPSVKIRYPLTLVNQSLTGIKEKHIPISLLDQNGELIYPEVRLSH